MAEEGTFGNQGTSTRESIRMDRNMVSEYTAVWMGRNTKAVGYVANDMAMELKSNRMERRLKYASIWARELPLHNDYLVNITS